MILNKSQFYENSMFGLLKDDSKFKNVLREERVIDFYNNKVKKHGRNPVLPMELGLCSDVVISYKIGMTAGLECAVVGKRVLILDEFSSPTYLDNYFIGEKICFKSLEQILVEILRFINNNKENDKLGDW